MIVIHFVDHDEIFCCYNLIKEKLENLYAGKILDDTYVLKNNSDITVAILSIKFGHLHGSLRFYYDDGSEHLITKFNYGKRFSYYYDFHNNGVLYQLKHYVNHKMHGSHKSWYYDGNNKNDAYYLYGKIHGSFKIWHNNGNISENINYLYDKKHGLCTYYYYGNGNIMYEHNFIYGKLHGLYRFWNGNGSLIKETNFMYDKKHGLYKIWNDNGALIVEENFRCDKHFGEFMFVVDDNIIKGYTTPFKLFNKDKTIYAYRHMLLKIIKNKIINLITHSNNSSIKFYVKNLPPELIDLIAHWLVQISKKEIPTLCNSW